MGCHFLTQASNLCLLRFLHWQVDSLPLHHPCFPGRLEGKESARNVGDLGSIPGLGRCLGEGNSSPLQYSCLEKFMDRGAGQATVCGVAKTRSRLND